MSDLVFIVGSVVYFKDKKLSYSDSRSVYSFKEREDQTLETVKSIHKYSPGAKVVLIEMGTRKDLGVELLNAVDQYIYVGSNPLVRMACDGPHKGLGEAMGLITGISKINVLGQYYFKLSGRYLLNKNFDLAKWNLDDGKFGFKLYEATVSTRLYGVPNLKKWKSVLIKCLNKLRQGESVESVLYHQISVDGRYEVSTLGVSGLIGPTGDKIEE